MRISAEQALQECYGGVDSATRLHVVQSKGHKVLLYVGPDGLSGAEHLDEAREGQLFGAGVGTPVGVLRNVPEDLRVVEAVVFVDRVGWLLFRRIVPSTAKHTRDTSASRALLLRVKAFSRLLQVADGGHAEILQKRHCLLVESSNI